MKPRTTLAASAALITAALFAAPQSANALPQVGDTKQQVSTNVEKAGYRHHRRYYRHRHWRHRGYYGHRHYYRRPGFGVYLGF